MINRFKLWFSKNDYKIFVLILAIGLIYITFKSANRYYEYIRSTFVNEKVDNIADSYDEIKQDTDIKKELENNETEIISRSSQEGKNVVSIVNKFINTIYNANMETDNEQTREDLYNMFSNKYIQSLLNNGNIVNSNTILDYVFNVSNLSDYDIGTIYKLKEEENKYQAWVMLRDKSDNKNIIFRYLIFNIDNNNRTFEYFGIADSIEYNKDSELEEIKNRRSNIF